MATPNQKYVLHALKYATITVAVMGVTVTLAGLVQNPSTLTGRLVSPQQNGVVPTVNFTAQDVARGFSVPADTHVIFTIPANVRIPRITFFGGPEFDQERYWGYCFTGNEAANKAAGAIGARMYDGDFFYSAGERAAQTNRPKPADTDLLGIKQQNDQNLRGAAPEEPNTIAEIFHGGDTCYVMSAAGTSLGKVSTSKGLLPAGLDQDGDLLNDKREQLAGTDPYNSDSDGDTIPDGTEVFNTKTNPLVADTDRDGLSDSCEDVNRNGRLDKGETSALSSDTDDDGLCDGNALDARAEGCPEERQVQCTTPSLDPNAPTRTCRPVVTSPVHSENPNRLCGGWDKRTYNTAKGETNPTDPETQNGKTDFQTKWDALQSAR
jgi:hypothetical protein